MKSQRMQSVLLNHHNYQAIKNISLQRASPLLQFQAQRSIGNFLTLKSTRGFLRRVKRLILKRIVVFRLLFYGSLLLGVSTIVNNAGCQEAERTVTPSYFLMHTPQPGERYKLSGVIKNGTIEIKKGTQDNRFILTDFKNDINVMYKGLLPATFREGDMTYVGGFLADSNDPTLFIGTSVVANHEISVDKYIGDNNIDRVASLNMIESKSDFEYTTMA